jgi:hypothetical protein
VQIPGVGVRRRIFFKATNLIGSIQNDGKDKFKNGNNVKDATLAAQGWGTRPGKPQGPGEDHRAP